MVTRRRFIAGTAAAAAATSVGEFATAGPARADYSTFIDPRTDWGVWEGWGSSLAWWANAFGMSDSLANLLYNTPDTEWPLYNGRYLPSLGLNIVRYNLGASKPAAVANPIVADNGTNVYDYKKIEGYWLDWDSADPASASWDWWVDSNQRNMLWKARDRGADTFELFSDSPLWWMCGGGSDLRDHNPSGAADGSTNLQPWNHKQHAVYLATVAEYARDNWGFHFNTVEPFNEPMGDWWKPSRSNQEGCHIDIDTQRNVLVHLRSELDKRGLDTTRIAACDENKFVAGAGHSGALDTWNALGFGGQSRIDKVNVHGYQYEDTGAARTSLYNAISASGRRLWNSEYGEGYAHGLYMAYNIALDLRFLHPTAWCYWQPIDGPTWGLLEYSGYKPKGMPDPADADQLKVNNKYFVLAQYTRHIRKGMTIIDSGDQATVAAFDEADHKLVLVTVRGNSDQTITYDLSGFSTVNPPNGNVRSFVTAADPTPGAATGAQYLDVSGTQYLSADGKTLKVFMPAYTIQTFEIDNVYH